MWPFLLSPICNAYKIAFHILNKKFNFSHKGAYFGTNFLYIKFYQSSFKICMQSNMHLKTVMFSESKASEYNCALLFCNY